MKELNEEDLKVVTIIADQVDKYLHKAEPSPIEDLDKIFSFIQRMKGEYPAAEDFCRNMRIPEIIVFHYLQSCKKENINPWKQIHDREHYKDAILFGTQMKKDFPNGLNEKLYDVARQWLEDLPELNDPFQMACLYQKMTDLHAFSIPSPYFVAEEAVIFYLNEDNSGWLDYWVRFPK